MKRLFLCAAVGALFIQSLGATVISGKIADLTGQTLSSNRTVLFELQNCGNNIPRVVGSAVIAPASKRVVPNAAGILTGTILGNDVVECGTTIGQTYYKVTIFGGTLKIWEKTYFIRGATWNIATAVPLSNDPTAFLNYSGYLLGDIIYGSGNDTLGLVRGNTSTGRKYFTQTGDGVHSGQPQWHTLDPADIPVPEGVVSLTGSYTDPAWLTLTKAKVGLGNVENTALSTWAGSTSITTLGTISSGTVPWARLSNVPATLIDSTGSYTDPAWLTLTKAKVGLGSVENTALSTWAGSANITTIGTLASGTVPWARVGDVPGGSGVLSLSSGALALVTGTSTYCVHVDGTSAACGSGGGSSITNLNEIATRNYSDLQSIPATFAPSAHTHGSADLLAGTYAIDISGAAGSVPWSGVTGLPTFLSVVGSDGDIQVRSGAALANVTGFNWTGTTFSVPGMLAVTPPALSQAYTNPGSTGDRRSTIAVTALAGTFTGGPDPNLLVDGSTGSQANLVITGSLVGNFGITFDFGGAFVVTEATHTQNNGLSNGNFQWRGTNDSTFVSWTNIGSGFVLGGATSQVHTTLNANAVAYRYYQLKGVSGSSNGSGLQEFTFKLGSNVLTLPAAAYHGSVTYDGHVATSGKFIGSAAGLIDSTVPIAAHVAGDYSAKITSGSYSINVTGDAGTVGTYTAAKTPNAYTHNTSFAVQDSYLALPTGTANTFWGLFAPVAAQATIASAICWSDDATAYVQLRRSDNQDIVTGNLLCNGAVQSGLSASYKVIATSQHVGMYVVSGTPKRAAVTITYTTAY